MNEEISIKKDEDLVKQSKKQQEVQGPIKGGLKTKEEIVANWLPRYTGRPLEDFGKYIILTNFSKYIQLFSQWNDNAPVLGLDKPMQSVTANGITIINFGMGSSVAATVMDLLTAISPKAVIFLVNAVA
jgi:AMP nucleosidase